MPDTPLNEPLCVLPRIGGMATMPSRINSLRVALPKILPQVDFLYLYFDKYKAIPSEFSSNPKIISILPEINQNLGCSGKFQGLKLYDKPCLYFCFDDDIIYPIGYVSHLEIALRRHHYRALIGVHGCVYKLPLTSYARDRLIIHFKAGLNFEAIVDELGTGTLAFHSNCIKINHDKWLNPNMSDLNIMLEAVHQKVQRICIRRNQNYIQSIAEGQLDSIFRKTLNNDSTETAMLQTAMINYPSSWSFSS